MYHNQSYQSNYLLPQWYPNTTAILPRSRPRPATATAMVHYSLSCMNNMNITYIHTYMYVILHYYLHLLQLQLVLSANNKAMIMLESTYMYWQTDLQKQSHVHACHSKFARYPVVHNVGLRAIRLFEKSDCTHSGHA
jgi:hypothetical protein